MKIGKSSRPVNVRANELDNTAVPLPFDIFATMKTSKYSEAEKLIHRYIERFTNLRIRNNREFFNIKPEVALDIFKEVATLLDDAEIEETYKISMFGRKSANEASHDSVKTPPRKEAKTWMIPANSKYFDLDGCITEYGEVIWRQHFNFQTGDIVYVYAAAPDSKLKYKCLVTAHDMPTYPDAEQEKDYYVNQQDFESTKRHNRFMRLKLISQTNSDKLSLAHLQEQI